MLLELPIKCGIDTSHYRRFPKINDNHCQFLIEIIPKYIILAFMTPKLSPRPCQN